MRPSGAGDAVLEYEGARIAMVLPDKDSDHIQRVLADGRFYEREMLEHASVHLEPGDLVIDAGAYIGTHTLFFAIACGAHVVAFEPNPRSYATLQANIELNDLSARVHIHQQGLGARAARARLTRPEQHNQGMARLDVADDGELEVIRLDDVELAGPPRMIKIDVEGMELDVLRGGEGTIRRHQPLLYIECASHKALASVTALLTGWGYAAAAQFNATPTVMFVPDSQSPDLLNAQISSMQYAVRKELRDLKSRTRTLAQRSETNTAASAKHLKALAEQQAALVAQVGDLVQQQAILAQEMRVVSQQQEAVAEEVRAISQHLRVGQRPLAVRVVRKLGRLARNFVRDPRKFARRVVRRRLVPVATRVSSFLVKQSVVPSVRGHGRMPSTSIVAVLGEPGGKLLTATFDPDTELVLLVDGRNRQHVARWLSDIGHRRCRLYLFERTQPIEEMLRYGLSRASGKQIAVVGQTRHASRRALASNLGKLPNDDDTAFIDAGELLVLRHHAARELVTNHDVRDGLATAFARICGQAEVRAPDTMAPVTDRVGVFFYTKRRYALLADQLLVAGGTLDRRVVYGRDPEPLLELLARQGDDAMAVEVVDTREMQGHAVYGAPPAGALFAKPAEYAGIVCFDRRPAWYRPVSAQVAAAAERVSVIMAVYNYADTLDAAIDSILEQSYRNLELIIVDDGSTDGSLDVVKRKMGHDRRIRLLRTPENSGTYVARNLGLVHATGDFVTFQDADDVSLANRIELQVAALHSDPTAIANLVRYQRISEETGRVLWVGGHKDRSAAITLMFRRQQVLDTIGFFDSVRVTADSEFVARLTTVTGRNPQTLPVVGYLARHGQGSLTTSGATRIKLSPTGDATLPPARVAYWDAAQRWHGHIAEGAASPYVSFPLRARPFAAPDEIVSGSWADRRETVTASLATMPERVELLAQTVASLLPQVDRLQVYLNNYDEVPEFLGDPKVTVVRSQDFGDLKDNGKFFGVEEVPDGYHFTVDDDIIYPPDYVQKSIVKIEQYERKVVVGVHGVNLADPLVRYTRQRRVAHFKRALPRDELVQLLGTGTLAYHTSTLRLAFDEFRTTGVADLWFAIQARRQGVGLLAQARPAGWLQPIAHDGENIFNRALKHDDRETAIATEHGPWTADGMAGIWRPLAQRVVDRQPVDARTAMDHNVNQLAALVGRDPIHFTLIVPGWNCADHVRACWESIERQRPGHYSREVYFIDDASTDGTWDELTQLPVDDDVHLIRHDENRGPAYARYSVLQQITDGNRVCVLVDLDDELTEDALWRLAEVYLGDPGVWLTSGSWRDQAGRSDSVGFYHPSVVRDRAYRDVPLFKCTHVRSFRRFLCDPLGPEHLQDPDSGAWLMHCSDVALMLPLLEQCAPENIVHLHDTLYTYQRRRDTGTIHRFGKDQKNATYRRLCALPRMPARTVEDAPVAQAAVPVGQQ